MRSIMQFFKCTEAVEEHDEHQKPDSLKCKKITTFYHFVREVCMSCRKRVENTA